MKLKDQIAVITGGSMGIGEAIGKVFVEEGAQVVLVSRDASRCEEARQRIGHLDRTVAMHCDVSDRTSIEACVAAVVSQFGRIDLWINNAGYGLLDSVEKLDINAMRKLFDTNLFGAVECMQVVIPGMKRQRSGVIANISSGAGYVGVPFMPAYCASKHALNAISHASRLELKQHGISIVSVCPGYVDTAFGENAVKGGDARKTSANRKRMTPERVARAVLKGCVKKSREVCVPWFYKPVFVLYTAWPGLIEGALERATKGN
ncbi:MAG TPA: SDR family NAD(P)-dependent oxidoreductase [Candidatus Koribacter sp.]|jgi:NAD(P)-dependent dehydrogenase (short-subunit alcohol dehydrogenase family)